MTAGDPKKISPRVFWTTFLDENAKTLLETARKLRERAAGREGQLLILVPDHVPLSRFRHEISMLPDIFVLPKTRGIQAIERGRHKALADNLRTSHESNDS